MDDRKKSSFQRSLFAAGLVLLAVSHAARADNLTTKLNAILANEQLKNADVSVHIAEITPKGVIERFAHQANLPLSPASNTKLMTTAAAFERYGAKASFRTTLYQVGEDLLLVGGADPALGDVKNAANPNKPEAIFEAMANELKNAGIIKFRDLIIDDRVCDYQFVHPAWPEDQRLSWYEAPVGGLNFNTNCLDWKPVVTAEGIGVQFFPPTTYVTMSVKATKGTANKVSMYRPPSANKFEMRGTVAATGGVNEHTTIVDPGMWTGTVARDTIVAAGITSNGRVRRLGANDDMSAAKSIAVASTPLMTVLQRANKQSVNMMAEALCKRLGHDATGKPGTWATGTAAVMDYAVKCGAPAEEISMDDGSGLSAKNRISSRAFTTVLAHVAMSKDGDLFVESLAEPGEDGTLKKRFDKMSVADAIHAKTGHISGVSTLSGYIDAKVGTQNRRFVFSILCNRYAGNVHDIQDKICQTVYEWATE